MIPNNLRPIVDVEIDQPKSLWNGRIPLGSLTLLEGYEGSGKATLMAHLAAAITAGRDIPEMKMDGIANVFWLSGEDHLSLVKRRLISAGADLNRVFVTDRSFSFCQHEVMWLTKQVENVNPLLIVIDPIFAYLAGDANNHEEVRFLTRSLGNIASQFNCAIVMIRHMRQPRWSRRVSSEFNASARSVLHAAYMDEEEAPDDGERLAVVQTKNNFGPNADRLQYRIEPNPDSPGEGKVLWKEIRYVQV